MNTTRQKLYDKGLFDICDEVLKDFTRLEVDERRTPELDENKGLCHSRISSRKYNFKNRTTSIIKNQHFFSSLDLSDVGI